MKLVDPIELTLDFAMLSSIEVPTRIAQAAIPEALDAVEIRPGISLAALVVFKVAPGVHGEFGELPAYDELVLAFHVVPSLRRSLPRLAFHVVDARTSVEAATRFIADVHWLNAKYSPVSADIHEGGMGVSVSDSRGKILEMVDRDPKPVFAPKETLGQVFPVRDGRVAVYHELIAGTLHEHQTRQAYVRLYEHPFWDPLEGVSKTPRVYLQMVGKPGEKLRQDAERPEWLGP